MVYFKVYADFVQIKYANLNKASMSIEQSFYVFGFLLKHSRITWLYMTTKHSVMKWKGWVCNTHALSLSSFIRDIYILKIYMMILTSPNLCSLKKIHRFTGKGIPIINLRRSSKSLQWRHNGRDSVSNHQPHHCLLNRLFRRRSKKTWKLRVTGLCVGSSPGTGEFPAQMASDAENVSIWWRHHVNRGPGAGITRLIPCLLMPWLLPSSDRYVR